MPEVKDHKSFKEILSGLTVAEQRQIGAQFIHNVLDLTDEARLRDAQQMAAKKGVTAEELVDSYHSIHAIYVQSHPRSDLAELDYTNQAVHFIAEACLVCLSPTYPEATIYRIADKVAMYCRMARMCASIKLDEETPRLEAAEKAVQKEIESQFRITSQFLE